MQSPIPFIIVPFHQLVERLSDRRVKEMIEEIHSMWSSSFLGYAKDQPHCVHVNYEDYVHNVITKKDLSDIVSNYAPSTGSIFFVAILPHSSSVEDFDVVGCCGFQPISDAMRHILHEAPDTPLVKTILTSNAYEVRRMSVHPECRRRGIGEALLKTGLNWIASQAAAAGSSSSSIPGYWAHLETDSIMLPAIGLYTKQGFELCWRQPDPDLFAKVGIEVLHYAKRISPSANPPPNPPPPLSISISSCEGTTSSTACSSSCNNRPKLHIRTVQQLKHEAAVAAAAAFGSDVSCLTPVTPLTPLASPIPTPRCVNAADSSIHTAEAS